MTLAAVWECVPTKGRSGMTLGAQDRRGFSPTSTWLPVVGIIVAVLLVLFILFSCGSSSNKVGNESQLPNETGKGLAYALDQIDKAGFGDVESHDALGRDRGTGNEHDWVVCFQTPRSGPRSANSKVHLGVVKIIETCPAADEGVVHPVTDVMPDLTNRTAYMAAQDLGDTASIRFVQLKD